MENTLVGASSLALGISSPSFAQQEPQASTDDTGLGDIVVTAQRRDERLQDVPIAVTAITSEALANKDVQNTLDLAQVVPALNLVSTAGATQVRIRGIGTTNFGPGIENPVAIYVDGIYMASTSAGFFNLANIERVETLKGPQGTLFGRDATGGLVQVVTPEPSETTSGLVRFGYGNFDTGTMDAYVTGRVTDGVSADFAAHYAMMGKGWGRNVNTGNCVNRINDDLTVRSKVKLEPSEGVKIIVAGDYNYFLGSTPVTLQNRLGDINSVGTFERILTNRADADPANDLPLVDHGGFWAIPPRSIRARRSPATAAA